MRTLLISPLLLPTLALAQPVYLVHDPVWHLSSVCANQYGAGPCLAHDTYTYSVGNDTVVGGLTYARILRSGSVELMQLSVPPSPSCAGTTPYGPEVRGLVRQQGRTLRAWDGEADVLLHDFELEVGDMLPLSLTNGSTAVQVTALDSVQMNGEWRRVFTLGNSWAQTLIEGVGSDHGLLEPITDFLECGYTLDCYGIQGDGYYPDPGVPCALPSAVAEEEALIVAVGPNPAAEQLSISLSATAANAALALVDATGRTVRGPTATGGKLQWDVADLPAGVFHLVARTSTSMAARTVVVMH